MEALLKPILVIIQRKWKSEYYLNNLLFNLSFTSKIMSLFVIKIDSFFWYFFIQQNCLFCIFCDKIFWSISEAKTHYILHLCPLKCSKCDQLFTTYDLYLSHICDDPKLPENIEWCRQYSDSINWIEKFIDYQQSDDIESFEAVSNQNKKCIVCEKVEKFRPQSSRTAKETKRVDHSSHMEKHLKYVPQFQCLICLLNCDKYFYCKNSGNYPLPQSRYLSINFQTL